MILATNKPRILGKTKSPVTEEFSSKVKEPVQSQAEAEAEEEDVVKRIADCSHAAAHLASPEAFL
jgi:hypothetical protein